MIPSIVNVDVEGKRVFLRSDLNVPLSEKGDILDESRLRASLPTIQHLLRRKAKVILASHVGRPNGKPIPSLSLAKIGMRLVEMLNPLIKETKLSDEPVGYGTRKLVQDLKNGELLLLENLRFDKREEENDESFSRELASYTDLYINDAFASCHRAHASIVGMVPYVKEKAAGFLLLREIEILQQLLGKVDRPYVLVQGGKKISDKLAILESLLPKIQILLIGGAMAHPFLQCQGYSMGASTVEKSQVTLAQFLLKRAEQLKVEIVLPIDAVISPSLHSTMTQIVPIQKIPQNEYMFDIGPDSASLFRSKLQTARTIFWNGPMGAYEFPPFSKGTKAISETISACEGLTVVGGGDSISALSQLTPMLRFGHISTGGGASLEFLEGKSLPGIEALTK